MSTIEHSTNRIAKRDKKSIEGIPAKFRGRLFLKKTKNIIPPSIRNKPVQDCIKHVRQHSLVIPLRDVKFTQIGAVQPPVYKNCTNKNLGLLLSKRNARKSKSSKKKSVKSSSRLKTFKFTKLCRSRIKCTEKLSGSRRFLNLCIPLKLIFED